MQPLKKGIWWHEMSYMLAMPYNYFTSSFLDCRIPLTFEAANQYDQLLLNSPRTGR